MGPPESGICKTDIYVDDTLVATAAGVDFREDLASHLQSQGFAGFSVPLPPKYCDGKTHRLVARFHGTKVLLENCPTTFRFPPSPTRNGDWVSAYGSSFSDHPATVSGIASLPKRLAASGRRKVAVFCGFSEGTRPLPLSDGFIRALQALGYFVLHVHATPRAQDARAPAPQSAADLCLTKHNIGYDFGSWLAGSALLQPHFGDLDELLWVNDSNFGPVFPLDTFTSDAAMRDADVFGLLDSYEISYHVQSYMVRLSARALRAGLLDGLAADYPITTDKSRIVLTGEIGLTRVAQRLGLKVDAHIHFEDVREKWLQNCDRYRDEALQGLGSNVYPWIREWTEWRFSEIKAMAEDAKKTNPTHYFWRTLYEDMQFPVLKRDLILHNPVRVPDWHMIVPTLERLSDYPMDMIRRTRREVSGLVPFGGPISNSKDHERFR